MAKELLEGLGRYQGRSLKGFLICRDVFFAALSDGAIYAGNIAYLSLVTLFPLAILLTSVTGLLGQTDAGEAAIVGFLAALPPRVAEILAPVIAQVITARSGTLLYVGGIVALWTVTGFVESVRGLIYRAYGATLEGSFIQVRLKSAGATLVAMILVVLLFVVQLLLMVLLRNILHFLPISVNLPTWVNVSGLIPPLLVFLALWAIFRVLTPPGFRHHSRAWPGALVTAIAWTGSAWLLGPILSLFGGMALTYGALTGIMVTMLFFYVVGFALVLGAELNAALAKPDRAA